MRELDGLALASMVFVLAASGLLAVAVVVGSAVVVRSVFLP